MSERFCSDRPYAVLPYSKRNWGGRLHSLCSYQGKLKPSIAHFLVAWFTSPGDVVLDPMAGVGTIPLEARIQGRRAVAGDLSELAVAVSRAKLEPSDAEEAWRLVARLSDYIEAGSGTRLERLTRGEEAGFGLNGRVVDYFHPETLREVLLSRRFFREEVEALDPCTAAVMTAMLHILHGNRPYALSRRSHPITPLKPTGGSLYRPVVERLSARLHQTLPLLGDLPSPGAAHRSDFAALPLPVGSVDAVITSPPFTDSLRFASSNWMRLWFCGWSASDFREQQAAYLEKEQRTDFDGAYGRFISAMRRVVKPGGLLILHVGATRRGAMAERIAPLLSPEFRLVNQGVEGADNHESHGLTDKGATTAHSFLFCRAV